MTREFVLHGLGCANCAAKIERSVNELENVSSASVNFITTTLRVEIKDAFAENIHTTIEKIVHQHEPDILVLEKTEIKQAEQEEPGGAKIRRLIMGAVVFAAGMALEHFFTVSQYVTLAVYLLGYVMLGGDIVIKAVKNIARGQVFDENFLMSVATVGALIIGEYAEAVAVMMFFQVGEFFQETSVRKSKKSITKLMDIRPDFANLRQADTIIKVDPTTVRVGDIIVVKPGEKIPLDGMVIAGASMLDAAALTGESAPRQAAVGDAVLAGCVNQNGLLTIEVTKPYGESTVEKIIDLVEKAAGKKAPTENFITKFARYYTPAVVGLALLIAVIPPLLFDGLWSDWLNRGLIFLVISCPCALVISIPLGFFGGIGAASKKGILIKGGNYLEALNNLDLVVFDKTGTLTKGVFKVTQIISANGFNTEELLELAANAEAFSNHPIALSIAREYKNAVDKNDLTDYNEIAGHGVSVKKGGQIILAGNQKLMNKMGIAFTESPESGAKVYVAANGLFVGCIVIADEIKDDSYSAVAALKAKGVQKTVMLTGDNPQVAEAIAEKLKIDEVYSGLLPHEKVEKLELLNTQKRAHKKVAFVGDGINDAPVLAMADIGVSMGGLGADAAIEAADVVLMTDEPSKLATAVDIARFTKRIVWQNIIFALGVKGLFLILGAFGVATMWEAVFADVGVSLLAVLNAMRVINHSGPRPQVIK